MHGTVTGTNTLGQSELGSNDNKWGTPHTPDLQDWSLTIRCSLMSYRGTYFFGERGRVLFHSRRYSQYIIRLAE